VVVSVVAVSDADTDSYASNHANSVWTDPALFRAVAIAVVAALHMNVYIVGLNQM
jgi:hypothetical protein